MQKNDSGYLNNPVYIIGCPKSGTTLLQALFDWHPQLLVFPVELDYYPILKRSYSHDSSSHGDKFNRFLLSPQSKLAWMKSEVYDSHHIEDGRDFARVNYDELMTHIQNYNWDSYSRRGCFQNIIEAYRRSVGISQTGIKAFVTKSVHIYLGKTMGHYYHYIPEILEDFPNAKIIHILRDPRDNYVSYCNALSYKLKNSPTYNGLYINVVLNKILPSFKAAIKYQNLNSNQYRIIYYEDLVIDTKKVMEDLVGFVGIDWDKTLEIPTICGKPWRGNSSKFIKFREVSKKSLGRYKNELDRKKIVLIEKVGFEEMTRFDYRPEFASKPIASLTFLKMYLELKRFVKRVKKKIISLVNKILTRKMHEDVRLEELLCPYRPDLLIRVDFLRWFDENISRYDLNKNKVLTKKDILKSGDFFKSAKLHPYFLLFTRKRKHRKLNLSKRDSEKVYAEGIASFINLYNSMRKNGYDKNQKIELVKALHTSKPDYGNKEVRKYYIGDGCHRFACQIWLNQSYTYPRDLFKVRLKFSKKPINSFDLLKKLKIFDAKDERIFDELFRNVCSPDWKQIWNWLSKVRDKFKTFDQDELFTLKFTK